MIPLIQPASQEGPEIKTVSCIMSHTLPLPYKNTHFSWFRFCDPPVLSEAIKRGRCPMSFVWLGRLKNTAFEYMDSYIDGNRGSSMGGVRGS